MADILLKSWTSNKPLLTLISALGVALIAALGPIVLALIKGQKDRPPPPPQPPTPNVEVAVAARLDAIETDGPARTTRLRDSAEEILEVAATLNDSELGQLLEDLAGCTDPKEAAGLAARIRAHRRAVRTRRGRWRGWLSPFVAAARRLIPHRKASRP